jgi:hypothetical protein
MNSLYAVVQAIFSRGFVIFLYTIITIFSSAQTMLRSSFELGASALAGTALAFFAACTFVGSFLARKEKKYRVIDLIGIGAIALIFIFGGFALAYWSGFQTNVLDYTIDGFDWLLVGLVAALFVTRKQDAL